MDQKQVFGDGEGDAWYLRNAERMHTRTSFPDLEVLLPLVRPDWSVLEIGCSDGTKLDHFRRNLPETGLTLAGIDPAAGAIEGGRTRYPGIDLRVGTADELPFDASAFDLVILGFCLYLLDRRSVFAAVAEVDRVLSPGGLVSITDFAPPVPERRPYHHREGVFSFKNDHAAFFLGGGHYSLAAKHVITPEPGAIQRPGGDRMATTILFKEHFEDIYPVR